MAALCCLKDSVIQVLNWDVVAGFQEPGNVSCRAVAQSDLGDVGNAKATFSSDAASEGQQTTRATKRRGAGAGNAIWQNHTF